MYEGRRNLSTKKTGLHLIDVRKPKAIHVTALKLYDSSDHILLTPISVEGEMCRKLGCGKIWKVLLA